VEIIFQLLPFARFDGYWALASITGIPDLFSRMGHRTPAPAEDSPEGGRPGKPPKLKPWVKVVFAVWAALTVPVMVVFVFLFLRYGPRFLAAFWDSFLRQAAAFSAATDGGDALGIAVAGLHMLVIALNIAIMLYFTYLLVRIPLKALLSGRPREGLSAAPTAVRSLWAWVRRTPAARRAGVLLVVLAVAGSTFIWAPGLVWLSGSTPPDGVQSFENLDSGHTEAPVPYEDRGPTPPVGGDRSPVWQNCGFYDAPVRDENAVHSMEHGAVWISYRPGLPARGVASVRELAREHNYVLAAPYPDISAPVVASAWGKQLRLNRADDPRLGQFVRAFSVGPQTPEPGAPCTGGKGSPG